MNPIQLYSDLYLASYLWSKEREIGTHHALNAVSILVFVMSINLATILALVVGMVSPNLLNSEILEIAVGGIVLFSMGLNFYLCVVKLGLWIQTAYKVSIEDPVELIRLRKLITRYVGGTVLIPITLWISVLIVM